jgi:hypothetical protein
MASSPNKERGRSSIVLLAIQCIASGIVAYWTIAIATGRTSARWDWLSDLLALVVRAASALGILIQGPAHGPDPARYIILFLIYLAIFRLLTAIVRRGHY